MNAGAKKGLIWGLVLTGVGVGIYYLVKSMKNKQIVDSFDTSEEEQIASTTTNTNVNSSTPTEVILDSDRFVQKGDEGVEVKYIQWGINNLIKGAKEIKKSGKYNYLSDKDKKRIDALVNIKPLKGDGIFGDKTLSAVKIVENSRGTNYCLIQKRRVNFHNKYKLKNPYGNAPICVDKKVKV